MAPEFASNVAHCDHIPISLIKLRPRVKLSTRHDAHLLVGRDGYRRRRVVGGAAATPLFRAAHEGGRGSRLLVGLLQLHVPERRRDVAMRDVLASQAVQSVHHLLHVAAAQITKAHIRRFMAHR